MVLLVLAASGCPADDATAGIELKAQEQVQQFNNAASGHPPDLEFDLDSEATTASPAARLTNQESAPVGILQRSAALLEEGSLTDEEANQLLSPTGDVLLIERIAALQHQQQRHLGSLGNLSFNSTDTVRSAPVGDSRHSDSTALVDLQYLSPEVRAAFTDPEESPATTTQATAQGFTEEEPRPNPYLQNSR